MSTAHTRGMAPATTGASLRQPSRYPDASGARALALVDCPQATGEDRWGEQPVASATAASFEEFAGARWHQLVRAAYLLCGDQGEAEDLVQTALVRTFRHWTRVEQMDSPDAYVRRILVNLANDRWRRLYTWRRLLPLLGRPDIAPDHSSQVDDRQTLAAALATLPPRMRAVLVLRFYEDRTEAETAGILGCAPGTVKSQTSRALAKLRTTLPAELRDRLEDPVEAA
jgi:RNA polymerase sigma-70 factor (sigma-E family)